MELFSADVRRNPGPTYDDLLRTAPVLHLARPDLWVVSSYDLVKRVLTDHDAFSSALSDGPATSMWLLFLDPPRHTKLRGLVTRAFTPRAVAALEPRIRAVSRGLVESLAGRDAFDLVVEYALPLPLLVIAEMLGAPARDHPTFRSWSDDVLGLVHSVAGSPGAAAAVERFRATHDAMRSYLEELLGERRARPRDDLLTALGDACVEGERLTLDELLGFFELLLVAGHETTTNLVANAVLAFVEHPDALAAVRADAGLLPTAVEEVLRLRSPVQTTFRVARRDIALGGADIPKGARVLPLIGAANRDPSRFAAPERFDVTRDPNPHVAFGHGIHFCIGASLARLEARIALTDLLSTFASFELVTREWEPRDPFHVHGPASLLIRGAR